MSLSPPTFTSDLTLYSHQVDPFYHAWLSYYLQLIQEAAGLHAYQLGMSIPHLRRQGMTWLLLRTSLSISRYASWPQGLTVTTWPQKPWKFYFPRATIANDEHGNELFKALSQWMVIDLKTRRPARDPVFANNFDGVGIPYELDPDLGRQRPFDESMEHMEPYNPRLLYSDMDFNGHINNISYVNWLLEALPHQFRDAYKVASIDISYLAETHRDDHIVVRTCIESPQGLTTEEPRLGHVIERSNPDGSVQAVCLAHTVWKLRSSMAGQ
jgi:acyl-ACP thioesterase